MDDYFAVAVGLLGIAMLTFTVFFLRACLRGEQLTIRTDLGAFGGGFGGWQFSPILAYLIGALLFGACFTFAARDTRDRARDKAERPANAVDPSAKKEPSAGVSEETLRVLRNIGIAARRAAKDASRAAVAASGSATAARAAAESSDSAAKLALEASAKAEGANKAAASAAAACRMRTTPTTLIRSCDCHDAHQPGAAAR